MKFTPLVTEVDTDGLYILNIVAASCKSEDCSGVAANTLFALFSSLAASADIFAPSDPPCSIFIRHLNPLRTVWVVGGPGASRAVCLRSTVIAT